MKEVFKNGINIIALGILVSCFTVTANAQVPSDLMQNCNQWKITYPNGEEDKTLCNEPNNEYFKVNPTGDAIVFRVPIRSTNNSTQNSTYIRSELRERTADGIADISWTTAGSHMVYSKQAITHLPIVKPHLVATQIHGDKTVGIDDAMVLRLESAKLFLSFNGGKLRPDVIIKTNYVLGTVHEVIFLVVDGKHYCYYAEDGNLLSAYNNGTASQYLVKDGNNDYVMDLNYDQSYFKIGNYTQSNPEKEGSQTDNPANYGEVLVYDFAVQHSVENEATVPNLALKKPVTYSNQQSTNPASNLVDGNPDTRWSGENYPVWVTVDLGAVYDINSTAVICHDDRAYKYIISGAIDGTNFTQIVDRSNNTTAGSNKFPIVDNFASVAARYVRITVVGATDYAGNWASIDELRVFGDLSSSENLGLNTMTLDQKEVSLWPNPTSNKVNMNGAKNYHTLKVFDQLGKLLINQSIQGELIDISSLKPGVYFFNLIGKDKTITKRIVKK